MVHSSSKPAVQACTHIPTGSLRKIVFDRLSALGVNQVRLPLGASPTEPHIPILVSPNLATTNRVILIFGEASQDLGIWAYRVLGQQAINKGCVVDLVKGLPQYANANSHQVPGIIVANTGQLLWHWRGKQAMGYQTWHALPRKTGVSAPLRIDEVKNRVPGMETGAKHLRYIFEEVVPKLVNKDAMIDILGVGEGGYETVQYLRENCKLVSKHCISRRPSLPHS